ADGDVIDNATVFGPEGTVNKKAVTGIAVTAPTTSTYEHGGSLALEGMTITVKYADDDSDNRTYKFENGKWHETTGGTDTELTGTPEDVTIKWNGTTTDVTDGAKLRLDDSDKGYTVDGDNKKATIKVAPSATGSLVEPATTDITIAKKQLALTVSGNVSKKYDGTNTLSSLDGITATLDGVQGTTPDDVSVDTTKLLNNIRYDGTGTNKAGITTGSPKLVIGTIAITGGAVGYYKAPVVATDATNTVTNNTTGTIEKRPVKVIAITETMDAAIGASNGKLEGIGSISYTLSSDNGLYQLVTGEDVKIDVDYTYGDTSTEGSTTVTYSNPKVSTTDNAYASNYDVSFNIAQGTAVISNGTVTGVTLSGPSQTGSYTHGDKFNLAGTEITITYNNDSTKTDKYSYDTESGKWTLTRNGGTPEATKVELPSELSLKLGSTSINTNPVVNDNTDTRTIVKFTNNTNTLVATYTKDTTTVNSTPSAEYGVEQKKITINITPPTSGPEIEQEYKGKNNKSLNDANLAKLSVEKPTNYAVPDETVSITEGTFKAEFASGSVARDQNGDVIAQAINIDKDSFTLDGADKGNYLLIINNTATGKVTPKAATITANKVPPIKEGAADLVVDITDYTTDGFVEGDTPTITWKGTYNTSDPNAPEIKVDTTTERTLDADTLNNYSVTWSPDSMNGTVTEKVVTEVKVITQPKFSTTEPKHGDKVGENGLDDLEYTVTYSDGSTTKHKKENGEWVTTDGYTEPEAGTTFKWNDTTEDVSKDSVIRKDKENTITITVEGEHDKTSVVTAAAKPVTVKAAGTYTKVYDGTNAVTLNETTPEITYTIEGLVEGDVITVTATPEFADENVAKFGDDYVKAINFTNVTVNGDDDVLANYEIAKTDDVVTVDKTDLKGAITPKEMKITAITVPSKKKGAAVAVSVTNSKAFTTTDIVEKDKDSVTIKYEGAYTSTSAVGENIAVTITDGTLAIDGDDKAMMNYTPKLTGSAAGSVAASSGGGGGGGGAPSNTLTIKDKTEDGKEGEIVKTLTAPAGSTPVDLIGVYKTAPKDPTIIWKSADEKIATVDENGVVSFISEGKTTITATSKTNSSLTAKVEVTVTAPIATPEPTTTPGTVNTPEPTKEPSVITKNMMNPYIVGYDDNVFGPELPISREEVATIFARLIANSIDMDKSYPSQFWDVTENEWSKDYIGYLETFDILHGYDDGSFMPKAYITRAEMAVMMARAEGYDIEGYMDVSELSFPDIPEDYGIWATKAIKYLTDAGVMEGYEDGTFRPTQPITRAETVATVNRVLSDMVVDKIEVLPSDVTDAHWAYDNIVFAMNHRVLKDAAADPNKFVWSEEFDQNIVVKQETVDGDLTDTADGENNSPSESDASAEQTDAPETTASPDAAPEATEMPKEETEPSVSPEPDKEN
ncbi:MAG: S-layer homology domain-containing protein, partial [Clostridia bacterium]